MIIAIPNFSPKDGLYQIDKGRIHKYKAKGGTVRVYDLIEIIQCEECIYHDEDGWGYGECKRPSVGYLRTADEDFCSYGKRETEDFDPYQGERDRDENGEIY